MTLSLGSMICPAVGRPGTIHVSIPGAAVEFDRWLWTFAIDRSPPPVKRTFARQNLTEQS